MTIAAPTISPDDPDRALACEEALADPVHEIARQHSADTIRAGDEAILWPLRRDARKAGWLPEEIDAALGRLAYRIRFVLEPGRPE